MDLTDSARRSLIAIGVAALLAILVFELAFTVRRDSQTWDEGCHIFAGYSYWTRGDFGMNPEHPPLVKLLATAPLLGLRLRVPPHEKVFSKEEDFTRATDFVFKNDAEKILWRTRMTAALLTLLLAVLLFGAAREMFGPLAAFTALTLFVFEPNLLAHGAVVTTDMGLACFLFATVYAFYRYLKKPSWVRLVITGLAAGLALATKHSGVLVFPILILLGLTEIARGRASDPNHPSASASRCKVALRLAATLVVVGLIGVIVLWSFYGFHVYPRPGVDASARLDGYAARLKNPLQAKMITAAGNGHLLPQSYLYGLADVGFTAEFSHSYLFETVYPHGVWFYFPVAFVIKTSLGLLILLALAPLALAYSRARPWRELLFLAIPAATYFLVAVASTMNIGVRHILPVYPFLVILAGWAAAKLIEHHSRWVCVVTFFLIWNIVSSVSAAPVYLAFSNELWGGPANTYKYLTDSNADWGQQLKATSKYLQGRHVKDCWFAYFAQVVVEPAYYGVSCKPLTTIASVWLHATIDVPASVDGPVLISAGVLSGYEFGPGALNPYDQFQTMKPTAVIEHGVFVFDGHFEIPLASALNHLTRAQLAAGAGRLDEALQDAETAVTLAPNSAQTQAALGDILTRLGRTAEAHQAFQQALELAETVQPEFQSKWMVASVKAALKK